MDAKLTDIGIGVSVSVIIILFLIYAFGSLLYKLRNRKGKTKETQETRQEKFIRHRPAPLKLGDVRYKRVPSQMTPQPLVITPNTPSQFTIPSRSHNAEDCKRSSPLAHSPDGEERVSPSIAQFAEDLSPKFLRTMSMSDRHWMKERGETPHGKIECFLKHDDKRKCLLVQILGKKGHSLSWLTGVSNPYIRVTLMSGNHCETAHGVSSQILNLPLNTKCELNGITGEDVKDGLLKFVVLDFDRFSRSEFVAEVLVSLGELENINDGVTVCEDLVAQQKVMLAPRGSLLISLCNQSVAQQLQVIIMKADGIPSKGAVYLTGSDLCVKTTLETAEACYTRKTKGPRKNSSYLFNEKLVFEVSSEQLTNASLTFDVTRGDSKLLTESKIGVVKLGLNSNQALEIRHWSEILASPQKQIAEWHQIRR